MYKKAKHSTGKNQLRGNSSFLDFKNGMLKLTNYFAHLEYSNLLNSISVINKFTDKKCNERRHYRDPVIDNDS